MSKNRGVITGLAVVCVIGGMAAAFVNASRPEPMRQIAQARRMAGLAPLPGEATGVFVAETGALTWTGYYLRFQAPARDIDAFLAASPGLRGVKPEVFTPKHKLLRGTGPGHVPTEQQMEDGNAYIHYGLSAPAWFDRVVREAGRRYTDTNGGNYGEVVVNDATHTVFVYIADS